jgi:hypothetical protein
VSASGGGCVHKILALGFKSAQGLRRTEYGIKNPVIHAYPVLAHTFVVSPLQFNRHSSMIVHILTHWQLNFSKVWRTWCEYLPTRSLDPSFRYNYLSSFQFRNPLVQDSPRSFHLTSLAVCVRSGLPKRVADCSVVSFIKFTSSIGNYSRKFTLLKLRFAVHGNSLTTGWIYVDLKLKPITFSVSQQPLVDQGLLIIY